MHVKVFALAFIAALTTVGPVRADIILGYAVSSFVPAVPGTMFPPASQIPANGALGQPIVGNSPLNPLTFSPGETKFIQVTIEANANAPFTPAQHAWDNANLNGFVSFGFLLSYPPAIVSQPVVIPTSSNMSINRPNANAQLPFVVGHPNTFQGYNMGGTAITGLSQGDGIDSTAGILPTTVIATMKFVATTNVGIGVAYMDEVFGITIPGFFLADGTNLEPTIFSPAHNGFPLYIQVIPEPSSIALAGLAIAGMCWRKLPRKTADAD